MVDEAQSGVRSYAGRIAMRTVPLGRSSVEISEFIVGAGGIGGIGSSSATLGQGITRDQGLDRLDEARELGISVIDTADAYGGGESERAVGEWSRTRQRHGVLLQTKVGSVTGPGHRRSNLSRPHIERQLARSAERLGRVDLFLSHGPDADTPLEETLEAFAAAQEGGLIRAFGMSNVDARLLEKVLITAEKAALPRPEWIQNGLSLLDRGDEQDLLPLVVSEGIGYTPFSPLAGGVLSDRYLDGASVEPGSRIAVAGSRYYRGMYTEDNLAKVSALRDLARDREMTVAGMALAWLRAHPSVTAPIVSPSRAGQWQAVREALQHDVSEEDFQTIADMFAAG
jgi:aryl-alcohol dehydrogenase-like predicted oxidoreductase